MLRAESDSWVGAVAGRTNVVSPPADKVGGVAGRNDPDVITAQVLGTAVDGYLQYLAAVDCIATPTSGRRPRAGQYSQSSFDSLNLMALIL